MLSSVSSFDESSDEAAVWNENVVHSMPSNLHYALHVSVGFNPPHKVCLLSHLTEHNTIWSQHPGKSCVLVGLGGGIVVALACIEHIIQLPALEEIYTFISI
jgi:hypothetical protein